MQLHFGRPDGSDFGLIVHQMPDSDFRTLTRSTVPLLCYWSNAGQRIAELCSQTLGVAGPAGGNLCFEYPVRSLGRDKPSLTDVMYLSGDVAIAVEGKSTEKLYETVERWVTRGPD